MFKEIVDDVDLGQTVTVLFMIVAVLWGIRGSLLNCVVPSWGPMGRLDSRLSFFMPHTQLMQLAREYAQESFKQQRNPLCIGIQEEIEAEHSKNCRRLALWGWTCESIGDVQEHPRMKEHGCIASWRHAEIVTLRFRKELKGLLESMLCSSYTWLYYVPLIHVHYCFHKGNVFLVGFVVISFLVYVSIVTGQNKDALLAMNTAVSFLWSLADGTPLGIQNVMQIMSSAFSTAGYMGPVSFLFLLLKISNMFVQEQGAPTVWDYVRAFMPNMVGKQVARLWTALGSSRIVVWWTIRVFLSTYIEDILSGFEMQDLPCRVMFLIRALIIYPWDYFGANVDTAKGQNWYIDFAVYHLLQWFVMASIENRYINLRYLSMSNDFLII